MNHKKYFKIRDFKKRVNNKIYLKFTKKIFDIPTSTLKKFDNKEIFKDPNFTTQLFSELIKDK
jgi:hypothetical protein